MGLDHILFELAQYASCSNNIVKGQSNKHLLKQTQSDSKMLHVVVRSQTFQREIVCVSACFSYFFEVSGVWYLSLSSDEQVPHASIENNDFVCRL